MRARAHLVLAAACLLAALAAPARAELPDEASHAGRLVSAWQADLAARHAHVRHAALVALAAIGPDAGATAGAVRSRLGDPHPRVADQAARTLAALGRRGAEALLAALEDPGPQVRARAADALPRAAPRPGGLEAALRARLADEVPEVRYLAAFALTAVDRRDLAAIPVLAEALDADDAAAQAGALEGVARLGPRAAELLPHVLDLLDDGRASSLSAAARALVSIGDPSRAVALARVRDARVPPDVRVAWSRVLARVGRADPRAAAALVEAAGAENAAVAEAALAALVEVEVVDRGLVAALAAVFEGTEADGVRTAVLETLARLGAALPDRLLVEALVVVGTALVPETYGEVLAAFGDAPATALAAVVERPGAVTPRERALRALGAGAANAPGWRARAIESAVQLAAGAEPALADAGARVLGRLGASDPAVATALTPVLDAPVARRAFAELFARGLAGDDREAWRAHAAARRAHLAPLAAAADLRTASFARLALGVLDGEAAALVPLLAVRHRGIRATAIRALEVLKPGDDAAGGPLARVAADPHEHPVLRKAAARALGAQPGVAPRLLRRLRGAARVEARRLWWSAATHTAPDDAATLVPAAVAALGDPDRAVGAGAVLTLQRAGAGAVAHLDGVLDRLQADEADRRRPAWLALAALGHHAAPAAPAVADRLPVLVGAERALAADVLAGLGRADVLGPVLAQGGPVVRADLLERIALAAPRYPSAALTAVVRPSLEDSDSGVREAAVGVLRALTGPGAGARARLLARRLEDPVGRVRAAAAGALGELGAAAMPHAEPLGRRAAEDPFAFVRASAREALRALADASVEGEDEG